MSEKKFFDNLVQIEILWKAEMNNKWRNCLKFIIKLDEKLFMQLDY